MAKLKLDPGRITVESFDPSPPLGDVRGTVRGFETRGDCPSALIVNCPSMVAEVDGPQSCSGTCQSCGYSCAGCTVTCPTRGEACWKTS